MNSSRIVNLYCNLFNVNTKKNYKAKFIKLQVYLALYIESINVN